MDCRHCSSLLLYIIVHSQLLYCNCNLSVLKLCIFIHYDKDVDGVASYILLKPYMLMVRVMVSEQILTCLHCR